MVTRPDCWVVIPGSMARRVLAVPMTVTSVVVFREFCQAVSSLLMKLRLLLMPALVTR